MNLSEIKTEIQNFPTVPLVDDTRMLIDKLLCTPEVKENELLEFADLLFGLSTSLAEAGAYIDDKQSESVVDWMEAHWKENNFEYLDLLVTILTNLSPRISKPYLVKKLNNCNNPEIKKILVEGINEI